MVLTHMQGIQFEVLYEFVQIAQNIFLKCKIYLLKLVNIFVFISSEVSWLYPPLQLFSLLMALAHMQGTQWKSELLH